MLLLGRLVTLLSPAVAPAVATDGMVCLVLVLARLVSTPRRLWPFPSFRTARVRLLQLTVFDTVPGVAALVVVGRVAASIVLPVGFGNFYLKVTEFFTSTGPPAGFEVKKMETLNFLLFPRWKVKIKISDLFSLIFVCRPAQNCARIALVSLLLWI